MYRIRQDSRHTTPCQRSSPARSAIDAAAANAAALKLSPGIGASGRARQPQAARPPGAVHMQQLDLKLGLTNIVR
jgi:hypothetical protein